MKDKKKAAEDLFYRIGYGRESRVVDRSLRRMIGEWNEHSDNDTIINVGDGYYKPRLSVPDEKLECKQYIAQETARAYRVLDKIKPMWAAFERMDKHGKREEEGEGRGAGSGEDFTQLRLPL